MSSDLELREGVDTLVLEGEINPLDKAVIRYVADRDITLPISRYWSTPKRIPYAANLETDDARTETLMILRQHDHEAFIQLVHDRIIFLYEQQIGREPTLAQRIPSRYKDPDAAHAQELLMGEQHLRLILAIEKGEKDVDELQKAIFPGGCIDPPRDRLVALTDLIEEDTSPLHTALAGIYAIADQYRLRDTEKLEGLFTTIH